jgi:2-methylaconitate cis-trans-isomerase PrpF
MMRTLAAFGAVAAATAVAARTGVLAKLGRRTTVRVVHPVR